MNGENLHTSGNELIIISVRLRQPILTGNRGFVEKENRLRLLSYLILQPGVKFKFNNFEPVDYEIKKENSLVKQVKIRRIIYALSSTK